MKAHAANKLVIHGSLALNLLVSPAGFGQTNHKAGHEAIHRLHKDAQAYIALLEDPQRESYQKPNEVIDALDLKPGEAVADIGTGSGYFAFRLSQKVGYTGRVYAVDVNPEMILHMNRRIRETKTKNVLTILAPPDDPLLAELSVDRIFICDTWHHVENQAQYLELLKKMLRPGGQIIMIDFHKRELPVGPPMNMKIAREDLIREMDTAGFHLVNEHTFLPYQYFLIFSVK